MNAAVIFVVGTIQFIVGAVRYFDFIEHHSKAAFGPHYVYVYVDLSLSAFQLVLFVVAALAGGLWKRLPATPDSA